jgi:hypothetical protein
LFKSKRLSFFFFTSGVTTASFHSKGIRLVSIQQLKSTVKIGASFGPRNFNILTGIPETPGLLELSRLLINFTTIGQVVFEKLKPFLTAQFGPDQFSQYLDPSMAFRQKIGTQATERLANVGGGAISGNTMRALTDYGQNLASTEYGNAFNRFQTERGNIYNTLANIAGMGQGAVNTGVNAGQNFAAQMTGLTTGSAAAQAAGQVGQANVIGGAATNLGNMAYLNSLIRKPVPEQGPVQLSGPA